ncbi:hypothetical protein VPLG_00140 [Vibrio phage eugene 12A10]|uniref:hypothetical protein n=1 Tax=Vibrio phage eugene 12A10 TaxID=573172 RepID=UPI0003519902|nr:hypothetical protein VPLG_00140 [Vibrio phage eugene 12A10]AGN51579.1 hypothetical protein VPLG_00140 [Vibrio phage eugene 12A10]
MNTSNNTFNANTTFVNCSESDELKFITIARKHFQGVEETLEFFMENGTDLDGYEHEGKTRRELLEEGFDRHEVKEILDIMTTFESVGSFWEYGLSFDFVDADENSDGYYRFQICWGGPSSEVRIFKDGTIEAVYMDWFVGVGFNVDTWSSFNWLVQQFEETCSIDWDTKGYEELYQEAHEVCEDDEDEE